MLILVVESENYPQQIAIQYLFSYIVYLSYQVNSKLIHPAIADP